MTNENKKRILIRGTDQEIEYLKNKYINQLVKLNGGHGFSFLDTSADLGPLFYQSGSRFFVFDVEKNLLNECVFFLLLPTDSELEVDNDNPNNDPVSIRVMNIGDRFRSDSHPDNIFTIIPL
jgi:hypothetical protein